MCLPIVSPLLIAIQPLFNYFFFKASIQFLSQAKLPKHLSDLFGNSKIKIQKTERVSKVSYFHVPEFVYKGFKSLMMLTLHFSHLQSRLEAFANIRSGTGNTHEEINALINCV